MNCAVVDVDLELDFYFDFDVASQTHYLNILDLVSTICSMPMKQDKKIEQHSLTSYQPLTTNNSLLL